MRSEFTANLELASSADWRAVLARRDQNRAIRHARAVRVVSSPAAHFGAVCLGVIGSYLSRLIGA